MSLPYLPMCSRATRSLVRRALFLHQQRREALRELGQYKAGVEAEAAARQQAFIRAASQEQPSAGDAATVRQELEATRAALAHARAQVSDLQTALKAAAEVSQGATRVQRAKARL